MKLIVGAARTLEVMLVLGGVSCITALLWLQFEQRYFAARYLQEFERMADEVGAPAPPPLVTGLSQQPAAPSATTASPEVGGPSQDGASLADTRVLARLRISAIGLDAPVLPGIEDRDLRRGAGWIPGTARPGELGNVGIAAHRDTFFRPLRQVRSGDRVELQTFAGAQSYVVRSVYVVAPDFTQPLEPTETPTLTLVTCFPFDFLGPAPRRYIVQAVADGALVSLSGR
jgi:LPXTG-site transpeptidase (sortase) family protein